MEEDPPASVLRSVAGRPHNVWETAVWLQVANRRLVRRADGRFRILPAREVLATDTVLPSDLRPCRVEVRDNGAFAFTLTDRPTNFLIYDRGDPVKNEQALREALPGFTCRSARSCRNVSFAGSMIDLAIPGHVGPVLPIRMRVIPGSDTPQAVLGGQDHALFAPVAEPAPIEIGMIHVATTAPRPLWSLPARRPPRTRPGHRPGGSPFP